MKTKKSQIAVEFIVLLGIGMLVLVIFITATSKQVDEFSQKREAEILKDTLFKAQNEIVIATKAEEGYSRAFVMPSKLESATDYLITLQNQTLIGESRNYRFFLFIPSVTGNISKGNNTIRKSGGIVYLNS